ncbi:MAG: S24 family peptidase [Syntrophomonas sp.]
MQEINFGKYLKGLRDERGLTLRQVQIQSGVSDSYLSQLETGQRGIPSPEFIKKLAPVYDVTYKEMLVAAGYLQPTDFIQRPGKANRHFKDESSTSNIKEAIHYDGNSIIMLPVYGKISAGKPINSILETDEHMPMDTRFFNMQGYSKEDFFFLRINGHSMEPTIADNDLVLIRKQPTVENNEIAAILCNNEDAIVRRVMIAEDKIILSSDNKEYLVMVLDSSECQIIGKVLKKIGDVK